MLHAAVVAKLTQLIGRLHAGVIYIQINILIGLSQKMLNKKELDVYNDIDFSNGSIEGRIFHTS